MVKHIARQGLTALIKNVEVEIGGQKIDKHYGEWMDIWTELHIQLDKQTTLDILLEKNATGEMLAD